MKRQMAVLGMAMALLLAGCGGGTRDLEKLLDQTLDHYAAAVRWGGVDDMTAYLDPTAKPPSAFELERLRQLQIGGYREQPPVPVSDTEVVQTVQIDFINRHTQESRQTVETMRWRYDGKANRWWLVSGLPKLRGN